MRVMLVGSGAVTSRLSVLLNEHGHSVVAAVGALLPSQADLFDFATLIVISPEAAIQSETLVSVAQKGKQIVLIAGAADGLAAWASASGVPTYPFPPSENDLNSILEYLRRLEAGGVDTGDMYRRMMVGGDMAARIQSGLAVRKIAITSPKGGTGKTSISVNMAVALALSGVTTFLVDADANAGAVQYHLRLRQVRATLVGLLRQATLKPSGSTTVMGAVAAAGEYLGAFTQLENLPTLKVLPGLVTDDLGDEALQKEDVLDAAIKSLYEVGVASGGVVVMDVGINPSHPVHRAALRHAEAVAIVIKPEIPDLAETRRWIARMIASLASVTNRQAALEFVGSRVKLCYNMVVGDGFKSAHNLLQQALAEDGINIQLVPNGIIPVVDPRLAAQAVNSSNIEDVLIWRWKSEHPEELRPFAESLIAFGTHFAPPLREAAMRVGLLPDSPRPKKSLFGRR